MGYRREPLELKKEVQGRVYSGEDVVERRGLIIWVKR